MILRVVGYLFGPPCTASDRSDDL